VVGDGLLIIGQTPASSGPTAECLKAYLDKRWTAGAIDL
jgi:hypothetical protein